MQAPNNTGSGLFLHHITVIGCALAFFAVTAEDAVADPCSDPTTPFTISGSSISIYFSIPTTQAPLYCGTVSSAGGTTINVTTPASGNSSCYVIMTSGAKKGAIYSISSVAGTAISVNPPTDQYCDDLTSIGFGDTLAIIPYWTLNTLWPGGSGVAAAPNAATATDVLIWNSTVQAFDTYYYKTGGLGGSGWRNAATGVTSNRNNQIIQPYQTIYMVRPLPSFTLPTGYQIQYQTRTCLLATPFMGLNRFLNYVSNTHYSPGAGQDLDHSDLANAFAPSTPTGLNSAIKADELLVFDNTNPALNKPPRHIYIYLSAYNPPGGPNIPAHWGDVNNPPLKTNRGGDPVFAPGTGVVISKAVGGGFSSPTYWIDRYP